MNAPLPDPLQPGVDESAWRCRLRAARVEYELQQHERGAAAGARWARDTATWSELRTLARQDAAGVEWINRAHLEAVLQPDALAKHIADRDDEPAFVRGFADGAIAIFDAIDND